MTIDKSADAREDFIKRLFAVAVSVGFASQMTGFIKDGIKDNELTIGSLLQQHGHEIVLLIVALVAVVASWEGYFSSIKRKPLEDAFRFYIDVGIVFAYLILMLTVAAPTFWIWTLTAIFGGYVIWDVLSMRIPPVSDSSVSSAKSNALYANSLIITIIWFFFFVALAWFNRHGNNLGFTFTALAAVAGVIGYRLDKGFRTRSNWLWKAGLLLVPVGLLFAATRT